MPSGTPERVDRTVLGDGRRLGWSEWGPDRGSPVLLFHGAPGSSHCCPDADVTRELGVRLIAVDRPGYGESDPRPGRTVFDWADDVRALLDGAGVAAAPVVGWSSGVEYALACAAALGDRIASLAIVAGDAPPDEVPGALEPAIIEARRADPAAARAGLLERTRWYAERPASILDRVQDDGDDPDARLRRLPAVRRMLVEMFTHGALHGSDGWVDDSIAHALPWGFAPADVGCPTTVWYGEQDALAERTHSVHLARVVPGAELRLVPDAGHSLPISHWRAILGTALGQGA